MNTPRILTGIIGTFGVVLNLAAGDSPALDPHLEPLRPWLEKTWKGEFKDSKADSPKVDVVRWERALNGKAVRSVHSTRKRRFWPPFRSRIQSLGAQSCWA